MSDPRISCQLIVYGPRPTEDLAGVLDELAAIGYDAAEIGTNFVTEDFGKVEAAFKNAGIACSGIHGGYGDISDPAWWPAAIEFCTKIGAKYIICSGVAGGEGIEPYITTAPVFNAIGKACADANLRFCYHNHGWEFQPFDGVKGIHKLCAETDAALVKLNMDVYWVTVGGEVPAQFIDRYGDRIPYYHFKDGPYTPAGDVAPGPYEFTELGKGTVDLAAALAAARKHETDWIVYEQDSSQLEPKEAAAISFACLKSLGL